LINSSEKAANHLIQTILCSLGRQLEYRWLLSNNETRTEYQFREDQSLRSQSKFVE